MMAIGAVLLLLIFALIAPQPREAALGLLAGAGDWFRRWAPFSYWIVAVLLVAAIASLVLVASWPRTQEPEDPMAKYKKDHIEAD